MASEPIRSSSGQVRKQGSIPRSDPKSRKLAGQPDQPLRPGASAANAIERSSHDQFFGRRGVDAIAVGRRSEQQLGGDGVLAVLAEVKPFNLLFSRDA
jgi:hypothetical protein